jgi:hypothetical protein
MSQQDFEATLGLCAEKLPKVAALRAKDTYRALLEWYSKFFASPPYQKRGVIQLNKPLLRLVAESFWQDLLRLKAFDPMDFADNHKQAAYIFKWISRLRPVIPCDNIGELEVGVLQANAWFALHCAQCFLGVHQFSVEEEAYIVYASFYRDVRPEEWSMIFYALEKADKIYVNASSMLQPLQGEKRHQVFLDRSRIGNFEFVVAFDAVHDVQRCVAELHKEHMRAGVLVVDAETGARSGVPGAAPP